MSLLLSARHRLRQVVAIGVASIVLLLAVGFVRQASAQIDRDELELTPIPSGPGIQICEPRPTNVGIDMIKFGDGCSLWLQWCMGFNPELGQTPCWENEVRSRISLHMDVSRLNLEQAAKLRDLLGVTHAVIGELTGTPTNCVLIYKLYSVPSRKLVGEPIKLTGTESDVLARLPDAARTILKALRVAVPHVPQSVGLNSDEIQLIGGYPWYSSSPATNSVQLQIDVLSAKAPLATFLSYVHYGFINARQSENASERLLEQGGGNFFVPGVIATFVPGLSPELLRQGKHHVAAMSAPDNFVLTNWEAAHTPETPANIRVFEKMVRVAPNNPSGWNSLAYHYSAIAQSIRRSRPSDEITSFEWTTLNDLYKRWKMSETRAVTLDPEYEDAWFELSVAATFAGDPAAARDALWKANSLNSADYRVYQWGLEMFQPKWSRDPDNLARVAHLCTTAPFGPQANLYELATELKTAGFPSESKIMANRAIATIRMRIRQIPNDDNLHSLLGYMLRDQGMLDQALPELLTTVRLNPNSDTGHAQLGLLYAAQHNYTEAIHHFKESLRVDNDFDVKVELGSALAYGGQLDEAEKTLHELLKVKPNEYRPNADLAYVLAQKKQYAAAIDAYKAAVHIWPDSPVAHREMCLLYQRTQQNDLSIQEGEIAVLKAPNDAVAVRYLAQGYALTKDYGNSIKLLNRAIEIDPKSAVNHLELGRLLIKAGKKDEGRAELKQALVLNPTDDEAKAAQDLLEKNP